ncbi:MAG: hypothetical protein PQ612_09760 [Rickettsiales bacterium]|nr:hypothetical protein [Pseudomonadota bacterium]MDA0966079.1 hypothetical protein [Pseudomonadota bacterium]MDG4544261.1 hypothetical protein [Rickettsiales bacterium]MDG4546440.1 hypothetical protein [Rickettsiales bacterium]MDG4548586.1 hypothetical protein [Rickettsiales bacterium]
MPDISSLFCDLMRNVNNPYLTNNLLFEKQVEKRLWTFLCNQPFITKSANAVDNVFCSGCEENCYMPVESIRKHDNTLVYIVDCDKKENIGLVELDASEVRPHKFNLLAFCNSLSQVMQSHDEATTLIPDMFYKIGRCLIDGSGYTVFLAVYLEDETKIINNKEYKNAVKPVIISINEIGSKAPLPCVVIDNVIYIDKNGSFGIFYDAMTSIYKEDITSRNVFNKEGENWQVSFYGKQVWVKHTKGCYYIAELLNNPNKDIKASSLQAIVDKSELPNEDYETMTEEELQKECLSSFSDNTIEILDHKGLQDLKNSLKTIDKQIEEAKSKGMTEKANQLKIQKNQIEEFIRKNSNNKGKSRKFSNSNKKVLDAVSNAIRTALKNIGKENPELSLHLKAHIATGHVCKYTPDKDYKWQTTFNHGNPKKYEKQLDAVYR